jgi:hypothetical protein
MSDQTTVAPQSRGALAAAANIVGILMGIAFIVAVVFIVAIQTGYYTPPAYESPTPTVRVLPTAAPVAPQPVQAAPQAPIVLPTALPVGQPVVPILEALPSAPDVPAPTPAVPAEIRTRGAVCFGGWWYLDGERTAKSCSGTGGD